MLTGMLLGVVLYRPIFNTFLKDANTKGWYDKLEEEHPNKKFSYADNNVILKSDTIKNQNGLDIYIRSVKSIYSYNNNKFTSTYSDTVITRHNGFKALTIGISKPSFSNIILSPPLKWKFIFLIWFMIVLVTMVYGPIAAFLVELFPTKIRYTSMSLPYHIGNGVFGGLVPFIATLLSATFTKDPLVGLWYSIGVAALCFIIGLLYLNNKTDKNIND